jgi:Ca-activated chloride channel family protein
MKTLRACLLVAAALVATTSARGDGFLIVERPHPGPDGHPPFAPLWVKRHHVEVTVRGQVATTVIDQEFENPTGARLEATYIFPVPRGAQIDRFAMEINGKMTEPELLPADKAREIYEGIVRSMRDPALLEYAGRDAFRARVFPIEPRGTKRIRLSYTEVVRQDAGLFAYRYPLNTEKFSSKPIPSVRVRVDLAADAPLGSIWSPSHAVEIERHADRAGAVVSWEAKHERPDTDFELLWQTASQPVAATLLTHREPGGDGWFLLLASPAAWTPGTKATPKDILFVVDTSGSMSGGKLDQARRALAFCVENLADDDRFDLIRFSSEAEPLFGRLEPNTPGSRKRAAKFIDGLKPNGGTAIDAALQAALESVNRGGDERRPRIVVFLTDGLPTVGPRDEKEILRRLAKHPGGARVFTFGVGKDVNTHLLDRLAEESRAFSQYVRPDEDLELKLSSFYGRIRDPMLAGITLEFSRERSGAPAPPRGAPRSFQGGSIARGGPVPRPGERHTATEGAYRRGGAHVRISRHLSRTRGSPHVPAPVLGNPTDRVPAR